MKLCIKLEALLIYLLILLHKCLIKYHARSYVNKYNKKFDVIVTLFPTYWRHENKTNIVETCEKYNKFRLSWQKKCLLCHGF